MYCKIVQLGLTESIYLALQKLYHGFSTLCNILTAHVSQHFHAMFLVTFAGGLMSIFLMGVWDPATKQWCTVAKCGNGHDDKTIEQLNRELKMKKISKVCNFKNSDVKSISAIILRVHVHCTDRRQRDVS